MSVSCGHLKETTQIEMKASTGKQDETNFKVKVPKLIIYITNYILNYRLSEI